LPDCRRSKAVTLFQSSRGFHPNVQKVGVPEPRPVIEIGRPSWWGYCVKFITF